MITKTNIQNLLVSLDDFKVVREINRGGFGIVYLIEKKSDKTPLAAKVNFELYNSKIDQTRFIAREISILSRVQAPTIIPFFGFSLQDFQGYPNITILMEYKDNGSLQQLIEQENRSRSPPEYDNTTKQIILCGIAHGMMILHSRRVLHRDLKPANVLLDSEFRPYISDFGLSKFVDPSKSKSQSQGSLGTIQYTAPEVLKGNHYGLQSDVYSFGILMYEVLAGKRAFNTYLQKKNFAIGAFLLKVMEGERPEFNFPIKSSLQQLIETCWSSNPHERPSFRTIFHKLSLSQEEDDETIESRLNDLISEQQSFTEGEEQAQERQNEFGYLRYCLEGVDYDRLFNYVDEITNDESKSIEQRLEHTIQEQAKIINEHQKQISQLTKQNQNYQEQINELTKLHQNYQILQEQVNVLAGQNQEQQEQIGLLIRKLYDDSSQFDDKTESEEIPPTLTPISKSTTSEPSNPLEGLSIAEMKTKIDKDHLTEITIPSSVTSIGDRAFYNCSSLTQITIPSSVTSIGNWAFSSCSSLTQITIPSSVTSIGNYAFCNCSSLTQITIPSSVTSIGDRAFSSCSSLTQITIPSSVTSIRDSAFYNCSSLTQITIPSSVTSIRNWAFSSCSSLTQITIPSSVTSIGDGAFYNCSSLTQITIPSSVTSIGEYAFLRCSKLLSSIRNELQERFRDKIF